MGTVFTHVETELKGFSKPFYLLKPTHPVPRLKPRVE